MFRTTLDVLFAALCIAVFLFLAWTGMQSTWNAVFFSHGLSPFAVAIAWFAAAGVALRAGDVVISHAFMR